MRAFRQGRPAALALVWGFAEATLFFIVPDVLLSAVALRHGLRRALVAGLFAAFGATLGGAATVLAARLDPLAAQAAVTALPGIDRAFAEEVRRAFVEDGVGAAFLGSFSGTPYKLYALAAGQTGQGEGALLLLTPLIRLPRFLGAVLLAWLCSRALPARVPARARLGLLAGFWIGFYAWYCSAMPA